MRGAGPMTSSKPPRPFRLIMLYVDGVLREGKKIVRATMTTYNDDRMMAMAFGEIQECDARS